MATVFNINNTTVIDLADAKVIVPEEYPFSILRCSRMPNAPGSALCVMTMRICPSASFGWRTSHSGKGTDPMGMS